MSHIAKSTEQARILVKVSGSIYVKRTLVGRLNAIPKSIGWRALKIQLNAAVSVLHTFEIVLMTYCYGTKKRDEISSLFRP